MATLDTGQMRDAFKRKRYGSGDYDPDFDLFDVAADEIDRLRSLVLDAERELENVLVSVYKIAPDKIQNPVLRRLREVSNALRDNSATR